jgi:hypothetical protein
MAKTLEQAPQNLQPATIVLAESDCAMKLADIRIVGRPGQISVSFCRAYRRNLASDPSEGIGLFHNDDSTDWVRQKKAPLRGP